MPNTISLTLRHDPALAVRSHGWARLAPFRPGADNTLQWAVEMPVAGPAIVTIHWDSADRIVRALGGDWMAHEDSTFLENGLAWMFRRDESFEEFWAMCERHGGMMERIAKVRAGALMRSGCLFEDVVKTLCTVNCMWRNTVNMVAGLCELFGSRVDGTRPAAFTFPTPGSLAAASEDGLRKAKVGFRARWIHSLANQIVNGTLDLNSWNGREDTAALKRELLALQGVGPYAANHILMILGHYDFIPADTTVASQLGLSPGTPTEVIERRAVEKYADWGKYAFLAHRFEGVLRRLDRQAA